MFSEEILLNVFKIAISNQILVKVSREYFSKKKIQTFSKQFRRWCLSFIDVELEVPELLSLLIVRQVFVTPLLVDVHFQIGWKKVEIRTLSIFSF